eukprot:g8356.t1
MSEHGGAHHAGALLHSPSQIRLRKRIESLEFVDDLHDDIASFLTKAHCEADVLKYLDGQLIYSRPANLDRDRWLKVKDSIYGPGANPNAAGAGGQAGAARTADVAGEDGGGGAPEGCAEGARTNGNSTASDQLPVNQPTQNQDPRFFWDSTSAGDFKGCKRVFGGPPFSSEIRWPKVVHEKTWETFLEISEVEPKVAEGAGGGAGESTEGGGKGGAGGARLYKDDGEFTTSNSEVEHMADGAGGAGPRTDGNGGSSKTSNAGGVVFKEGQHQSADSLASSLIGGGDHAGGAGAASGSSGNLLSASRRYIGTCARASASDVAAGKQDTTTILPTSLRDPADLLQFSSCFESGNLKYACFRGDPPINGYNTYVPVYDLILDHDTNSLGHVQWFYFAVRGFKRAQTIRFRIINSCKGASLFQMGMRPLVWSELHTSKVLARLRSGGSSKGSSASGATSAEGVGMSFSTPPGAASSVASASSGATASVEHDIVGGPTSGDNFDGSTAPAPGVSITSTRHGGVATEVATNLVDPLSSSELLPKLWRPTGENVTYSRNRIPRAQRAQHRPVGVAMGRTASTGNLLGVHAQMNGGENNGDGGPHGAPSANGEQFGSAGGFSGTITSGFGVAGGNSATNMYGEGGAAAHPQHAAGNNRGRGGAGAAENNNQNNSYFTLTFDITFEYDNDTCYIAYTYPYTYSSLRSLLRTIQTDYPEKAKLLRRRQLCQTLGRAEVDLLSVSNWNIPREDKRYVVVSSRVHPGEANASWLMHGFLNFILSNSPEAQVLRSHFIFKIVPMLNPDGVVSGNYRCSLAGVDLNRQWRFPDPVLDQSVYELKRILFKLKKQLVLYLDLHGHSRQTSLFAYGCSTYAPTDHRFYTVRMYPKILSVLAPEFSYPHYAGAAAKDLASNSNSNSNAKEGPLEEKKNSKDSTTESSEGGGDQQGGGNGNEGANKNGDSDDDGDDDVVPAAPGHQAGSNSNKLLQSKSFKQVVPFTPHKLSLLGATLARGLLIHFHLAKEVQQYQLSKSTFRTYLGKGGNAPPKKKQNGTKSGTPSDDVTEAEAAEGKAENEKVHSPSKKSPKKRSSSSSPKKKVASIVAEQQGRSPKKKKDSSPSKKKKKSPKKKKAKKAAVDEDDVDGEENDAGDNENDELRSDAEGDEEGPTCGTKKKFTLVSDADEEPDGEEEEGQTSSASEGEVLVEAAEIKRKEADKEPDAAGEQEENDEENEKDKESEEQVEDEEADPTLEEDDRMNSPVKTSASSLSPIKPGATAAVSTMSMAASPMKTQLPGGSTSPSKGSSGSAALSGGLASFASFLANGTKSNSWVGKNVVPIHGLEFEAAPDDVRLFDFLSAESEQVWMAAQRGESVAVTKSWMNENKKLLAARAAALDIAGSSPTKQLAAAAPASSSSTTASGGESDGQKVCSSASGAEGQADTSSAVPTRLKHWENEMQSGLQAQGVRFSPDTVEESRDAGATSSLPPDLSVNGTKAVEQNKNSMSGINVEALMREILIESQEKTKKKKDPEPSDELEEGSDSNPSGDNLSPEKLRKMRERMGSRDGTNGGGKRNRIRVGGEGRGDGVRARGGGNQGHFHGLMRHYLQVRNLFNAKEDLAIRQQKMSLLNRIVAFGRTTYISKNSQNAQSMPDLALAGTGAAAGPGDTTTRGDDGTDMANALAVAEKAMQQQAGGATAGAAPAGTGSTCADAKQPNAEPLSISGPKRIVGQPLLPGLALSSVVQPGAPCSSDVGADPSRNPNLVLVLEETHKSDQEQHGGSQEKLPRRRPMPMTILTPTHARSSASSSAGGSANASPVKGDADREQMMREQEDESRRLLEQVTQSIDTKIYEEITPLIPHTNYHHAVDKATASMLSNRQLQNPANNVDPPGGATSQPQVAAATEAGICIRVRPEVQQQADQEQARHRASATTYWRRRVRAKLKLKTTTTTRAMLVME